MKIGDKVRRIGVSKHGLNTIIQGKIYTLKAISGTAVRVVEVDGTWDTDKFEPAYALPKQPKNKRLA